MILHIHFIFLFFFLEIFLNLSVLVYCILYFAPLQFQINAVDDFEYKLLKNSCLVCRSICFFAVYDSVTLARL